MTTSTYEPGEPAAIRLTQVKFSYTQQPRTEQQFVLHNLSLAIPPGTITAILGPNGVGKTTLLNLVLGWLYPSGGSISLFGREMSGTSRREMGRTLSLVPQDEHVPFEYTTLDYVLLGRAPYLGPLQAPRSRDVAVAREALEKVGLSHLAHQSIGETSGGEKQLAMVARALAQQPRVLLMDEPTAHLDLRNKRRTVDLMHQLQQEGVTVVFTTHDPEFAAVASDRMVLLEAGRLLAEGPVGQVMTEENLSRVFVMPLTVRSVPGPATGGVPGTPRTTVVW